MNILVQKSREKPHPIKSQNCASLWWINFFAQFLKGFAHFSNILPSWGPFYPTCLTGARTWLWSLHTYEKMLDLSSVCCSFGLQSFSTFVSVFRKENRVPFCSSSYYFKPSCSNMKVSWGFSSRKSNTTTKSPIDSHFNEWKQLQDDGIGISKITQWVSILLFCPEPNEPKFVAWIQRHRRNQPMSL